MSRENARILYLSVIGIILTVCVIVALGESRKTSSNGGQGQCDTTQYKPTKCDTVTCDQHVGK